MEHICTNTFENPTNFDPSGFEINPSKPQTNSTISLHSLWKSRLCTGDEIVGVEVLTVMYHPVRKFEWFLRSPSHINYFPVNPRVSPIHGSSQSSSKSCGIIRSKIHKKKLAC